MALLLVANKSNILTFVLQRLCECEQ